MDPLTDGSRGNLVTTRLRLRSWRDEDASPMLAMSTDPEVMRHFPRMMTAKEVQALDTGSPPRRHVRRSATGSRTSASGRGEGATHE
jgi:RimJ/RimL family protein N-acetyltransferase